jgi:hypothetical protein
VVQVLTKEILTETMIEFKLISVIFQNCSIASLNFFYGLYSEGKEVVSHARSLRLAI